MLGTPAQAQDRRTADKEKTEQQTAAFFTNYSDGKTLTAGQARMQDLSIDDVHRRITVTTNDRFAQQDFTEKSVRNIYKRLRRSLPKPYSKYDIKVMSCGMAIEDLVPGAWSLDYIVGSTWGETEYDGLPWVFNTSRPFEITHGLQNRHIALWASHGMYYDQKQARWKWQRPNLFGTTEDLFTQTIVVPYLMPMLESAGAVVYSPRERDWQTNMSIVDNDTPARQGYSEQEEGRTSWSNTPQKGYAHHIGTYRDGDEPFSAGTARMAKTSKRAATATAFYQPTLPADGRYAVYVSYQTLDNSIPDAEYTVYHKGEATTFRVNQQMGGSTWVYLGTFDFDAGSSPFNRVVVSNQSRSKGVVTIDAVRFGGGMGSVVRGGTVSGMPRCLEGARYSAQLSGVPYRIYSTKSGADDYADDINVRPLSSNWLAGGSVYVPAVEGQKVPLELSLAVHSDAGWSALSDGLIGSLAICTTNFNDGRLNSGVSRLASKDFAAALLSGIERDVTQTYGRWNRRELFDRNYSETRNPEVPSAIIETLSHQNFADMLRGHDPNFKFTLARSIYKTIVRYIDHGHGHPCVIQPLAPNHFRATLTDRKKVRLSWLPVADRLEPTAVATSYCVYTATGQADFDNGRIVDGTSCELDIEPNTLYRFRVTAVNRGGESFPTEVLAVYSAPKATRSILIVNGFKRLSGPAVINDATQQGFDLATDIGVSYGLTAGWSGQQTVFDRSRAGKEGASGLGYCGNEMAGQFVMGNTFDYVATHADAFAAQGRYNVVSASVEAVEGGLVPMGDYDCVDLILGLQQNDGHSLVSYKSFPPTLQQSLSAYTRRGGAVLVSGAYLSSDMQQPSEQTFLSTVFKLNGGGQNSTQSDASITGLGLTFDIFRTPNPQHYAAMRTDIVMPTDNAFSAMAYPSGESAAVAYEGTDYRSFAVGFPLECIKDRTLRRQILQGIAQFLLP